VRDEEMEKENRFCGERWIAVQSVHVSRTRPCTGGGLKITFGKKKGGKKGKSGGRRAA